MTKSAHKYFILYDIFGLYMSKLCILSLKKQKLVIFVILQYIIIPENFSFLFSAFRVLVVSIFLETWVKKTLKTFFDVLEREQVFSWELISEMGCHIGTFRFFPIW